MIFSRNPARGSRVLNGLALLGVTSALGMAFFWQIAYDELPCPLCLLQRVALLLAGVGFLLNMRLGPSPMHYAMSIAAALGGMLAAGRQVLLHIAPGDPGYGSPFLGLHFYTWAFIAFAAIIVFCADAGRRPQMGRQHAAQAGVGAGRGGQVPVVLGCAGQCGQHHAGVRFGAWSGQPRQLRMAGFRLRDIALAGAG